MNRRLRLALMALGLVVIVVFCWFVLLNPVRGDIAATNASIDTQRTQLAAAQAKLAQAETTRQEGEKNQARLLELAKMVPESEEIPSLLLQIQDLADQSGIAFISITPGDAIAGDSFQILPMELEFSGTYFDLSDFVYRAEQLAAGPGRLLAIKSLKLQLNNQATTGTASSGSAGPVLGVNMTLYAFEIGTASSTIPSTTPAAPAAPATPAAAVSAGTGTGG
jgi:Tfp pilus assembly protein PilO